MYSIGIKHVGPTEGVQRLIRRRVAPAPGQNHQKPMKGQLCEAFTRGQPCGLGRECPRIHVSARGYEYINTHPTPTPTPHPVHTYTYRDTCSCVHTDPDAYTLPREVK